MAGYLFLLKDFAAVKNSANQQSSLTTTSNLNIPSNCDATCRAQIEQELAAKLVKPTAEATPTPVATAATTNISAVIQPTSAPNKTTTYIPFSSSYSTMSTDWVDVTGDQAYIDLKNNYSADAYVTFEATIKATSGVAYARLFDSTHGIAVDGSEISTTSNAFTLVSSGKLNLWSGNNLYKVQIKSLDSSNVGFDSGRIKLVY